jgi:hypothetical protein
MFGIHRFTTSSAVALALCVAAPAAAGAQDLRTPDAIDAASVAKAKVSQVQDLRSPDAADAAAGSREPGIDLRSPDVRFGQPDGTVVSARERVRIVEVPSSGFEWGDAGIGAAGMLAATLLALGLGLAATHYRERRRSPAAIS